jgi:hypothetical protein
LGITDLFKKRVRDEVVGTRVLVAVLDGKFSDQAFADRSSYAKFYAHPTQSFFQSIEQLRSAIKQGYDVVHLFCDVSNEGLISSQNGDSISGTALIKACFDSAGSPTSNHSWKCFSLRCLRESPCRWLGCPSRRKIRNTHNNRACQNASLPLAEVPSSCGSDLT